LYPKDSITLGEGRGNTFIMFLKEGRIGDCGNAINSKRFGTFGGNYTRVPSLGESLWKKMIGKPYSGKPNVRFDEGEMETPDRYSSKIDACIEKFKSGSSPAPSLYSTESHFYFFSLPLS
jgi:hypothetical protein